MSSSLGIVQGLFGLIAGLGVISSLARPDYNVVVFSFLFLTFKHIPIERRWRQYRNIVAFIIISIFQDIIYFLYWPIKWYGEEAWSQHRIKALLRLTTLLIIGIICLKGMIVALLFYPELKVFCCPKRDQYLEYEVVKYHKLPANDA